MTDAQWSSALKRSTAERSERVRDEWLDLRGGAYELSHVLERATKDEPARFAVLGLRLDSSFNDNYLSSILRGLGQTDDAIDPEMVYGLMRHAASVRGHDRWLSNPLARLDDAQLPDDIIEMVVARALGRRSLAADDRVNDPVPEMQDAYTNGLNTIRGGNIWALTRLIAFDADGTRTRLVAPYLDELAGEPSPDVRSLTAELIRYATRWEPEAAVSAFSTLVRDRAPALTTEDRFSGLIFTMTMISPELVIPVADDLLGEDDPVLREHGAHFRALVAIEGGHPELLAGLDDSRDPAVRRGAALILAARARWTDEPSLLDRLAHLFEDEDEGTREAAATVVPNLRGQPLARYRSLLSAYIASDAAVDPTQLLITLEHAPEPEHELILQVARRMIETQGSALGDIRTGAAGDARYLTQLLLRSYSVVDDTALRSAILDAIDELLEANAYGIASAIDEMAR